MTGLKMEPPHSGSLWSEEMAHNMVDKKRMSLGMETSEWRVAASSLSGLARLS